MVSRPREFYERWIGRARRRRLRFHGKTPALGRQRSPTTPRPSVPRESTHLGSVLDAGVHRARRNIKWGVDPDYDVVAEHFDVMHYLLQAPRLLERPGIDLVHHFLSAGADARLSPEPSFSMEEYLARYPERRQTPERSPYLEWLKRGRAAGEIADPTPGVPELAGLLGMDASAVTALLTARRADLVERLRTGTLGEMVARAAEIDPLVAQTHVQFTRPRLVPLGERREFVLAAAIRAAHEAAGFRAARVVLVINRPRWGGGRRMEGHLAHALATRIEPEDFVVVYTEDSGNTPPDRFPVGVREVDFAGLTANLEAEDAEAALVLLLRSFRADAIVNINSATLYRAMASPGGLRTDSERVYLCFFCNEQTPTGAWTGWSLRYFYKLFDQVAGVFTDSHWLADELVATHQVPDDERRRLHVLEAPVDPGLPFVDLPPRSPGRRARVFWAGRWDRQKRIPLLLQIAREMPDVDFHMWGEPVLQSRGHRVPPNVTMLGRYDHISDIPLHEADAWLYTSAWDGVPSQLLEVGMTGIPVVGTLVGGTGEILTPDVAWPVAEHDGAGAYVQSLREVLSDPTVARARAAALRRRLLEKRSGEWFAAQTATLLLRPDDTARSV